MFSTTYILRRSLITVLECAWLAFSWFLAKQQRRQRWRKVWHGVTNNWECCLILLLEDCGRNSTKEGMLAGVSFLTFPIIMDQQIDSKMIVEDWMVGWRVKEDVKVNTTTLVKKDEIAMLVQKFMDLDSNLAREIRERSETLRQICSRAITNGGSAVTDLNAFVKDLVQTIH